MPLTAKGEEILANLTREYGAEHAKRVLYAGKNSGRFTGIDDDSMESRLDEAACRLDALRERMDAYCARRDALPAQYSTTDLLRLATELQTVIAARNA